MSWRRATLAALLAGAGRLDACPLTPADGTRIDGEAVQVAWSVPTPVVVGRHFTLQLRACPPQAELLRVDATMPAHRHGMNYRPSVTPLGPGRWQVDGLMFHMGGTWALQLDLRLPGQARTQTLRQAIELP